jgi:hypothetical protein
MELGKIEVIYTEENDRARNRKDSRTGHDIIHILEWKCNSLRVRRAASPPGPQIFMQFNRFYIFILPF